MLHTLPVRDPGQLVELLHHYPGEPEPGFNGFSWDAYQIMRDGNHVFSDLIVGSLNLLRRGRIRWSRRPCSAETVGGTFFEALGVRPAIGRLIGPEDVHMGYPRPSSRRELVILEVPIRSGSWNYRQENRRADDTPVTIIGVAQRGFYGLSDEAPQDIWWPISLGPSLRMGVGLAGTVEARRIHRTSASGNGGAVPNGGERPRRRSIRASNETPDRAGGKRRYDAFEPDALDTADGLDGNGGAAAAPCVREFSRAAPGPWSIAPARNGRACLPRSGLGLACCAKRSPNRCCCRWSDAPSASSWPTSQLTR